MFSIVTYTDAHFDGVDALWREAFPNDASWNAANISIPEKLKVQPDLLMVAVEDGLVVGSVMAGYDGHRGWISRIAVLKSGRHQGIGEALIQEAEKRLAAQGSSKSTFRSLPQMQPCWAFIKALDTGWRNVSA